MDKERLQAYTARVLQANRSELVVILYELVLDAIEEAKIAYNNEDIEGFEKKLEKAVKCVNELIETLDYKYVLSLDLLQLYLYVNKSIIKARIQKLVEPLETGVSVMNTLLVGFEGVAREDNSFPVMQNSQQLYAGITYGKGALTEMSLESEGFKA